MDMITEGKAKIKVKVAKIVSKEMPVFYNPVMELNRTISVLLLNSIDNSDMQIGSPLAGSGIREIRFIKEVKKGKIKTIFINDYDKAAVKSIKDNLRLNGIRVSEGNKGKVRVICSDANLFMLNSFGFDYIDIDPFGTPNPFLDSAVKRISRGGILAVTATDTSALSGTHVEACMRKYWAMPMRNEIMHEIGLRILIRKCQLIGAQFEKALTPIYSYSKDHYMRVFFVCEKGKQRADEIVMSHGNFNGAGPLWLGRLWDEGIARKIFEGFRKDVEGEQLTGKLHEYYRFMEIIKDESKIKTVGFYDIPMFIKNNKLKKMPKQDSIIGRIREKGYNAEVTHFAPNSIRSDIPKDLLVKVILELS